MEMHQIGQVYLKAGHPKEAIQYFRKSSGKAEQPADAKLIAMNELYIAVATGQTRPTNTQLDSCFKAVLERFQHTKDSRGEYLALHEYGLALERQHRYDEAVQALNSALQGREKLALEQETAQSLTALARIHHEQGDDREAVPYLHRAEQLVNVKKYPETLMDIYRLLHRIYLTADNEELAAPYRRKLLGLERQRDETIAAQQAFKTGQREEAERLDLLHALDRAEQAMQFNRRIFLAIVGMLLLLVIVGIMILHRRQREKLHRAQLNQLQQEQALKTAAAIMDMREQERAAIASHLHDEVGALIAVAKLNLRKVANDHALLEGKTRLVSAQRLLDDIGTTVRHVSHGLMPPLLEKVGLKAAVTEFVEEIMATEAVSVSILIVGLDDTSAWKKSDQITLYRMVQELIANALKHAHASKIDVQLVELENEVTLMVEDDGRGMESPNAHNKGMGLALIRKQVEHYGGQLEISGRHPRGTAVVVVLPLPTVSC
ncbi:tetratricopeptide repeat-containing sensor histidine kinase [Parapedobacter indicus]|uniref:histidine kinase n=1 Tax=Parapedobacter indicus TaxID=1477437 RepID=A0A1I3RWU8_9SPHI|nr:tetratricopeptide repeat-containing sensor histidine kinase [Parapedobacter indicus]PPK99981.1 signal transduction histidine kinase [Parapedobacter indicus]SFJ49807.1 Signal transduction histidine kinase [Parapedobacter indicus]